MNIKIFFLAFFIPALLFLPACRSKKESIREAISSPTSILPSIVNVRYSEGVSGVESCKDCHSTIVNEWKDSFLAQATSSKLFFESSDRYNFGECMQCHAPEKFTIGSKDRPPARSWHRKEGVTCSSCHVEGNRIVGPFGSKAPHGTRRDEKIRQSIACAPCHQQTHTEWNNSRFAESDKTCQDCHMPAITRKITDYGFIYTEKAGKKHTFSIDFSDAVELDLSIGLFKRDQLILKVTNKGAGHNLPTGIYGETAVFVELRIFDREKQVYFREEKLMARDGKGIKPNESRNFFYTFKPRSERSHLATARVYFTSVNYDEDIKLAEISRYFGDAAENTPNPVQELFQNDNR